MIRVSCITPTTHDREHFNRRILEIFNNQDYPNKEHIFDYGDGTIGAKRNRCNEQATGEIILHLDSDDAYSNDWVTKSVEFLTGSGADITGLANLYFYNKEAAKAYKYMFADGTGWVAGATMCYKKSFWQNNRFRDMQVAEDTFFVLTAGAKVYQHDYINGFVSLLHSGNTSPKKVNDGRWFAVDEKELPEIKQRLFSIS